MKKLLQTSLVFIILTSSLFAQDTVRIMTYNVLKYPNHADTRNEYLARAVRTIQPDVLICQEMQSQSGVDMFLADVLTRDYSAGTFLNGNDTDNAIFYKYSTINFIEHVHFYDSPRNISQFKIVNIASSDTLLIFSVHLKASNTSEDAVRRNDSAEKIRDITDDLKIGTPFILLGDFNIYYSNEPAYQTLLDRGESGYFIDPISSPGNWNNNYSFRYIHTQSTRTTQLPDGGASGGLDDRFDMILISQGFDNKGGVKIDNNSYTAYGNDGGHFNNSINVQPNNAVTPEIADALYFGSDHLPVFADFIFPQVTDVSDPDIIISDFELLQNYPNPFNPSTKIKYSLPAGQEGIPFVGRMASFANTSNAGSSQSGRLNNVTLKVYDLLGREVATLVNENQGPGQYEIKFNSGNLSSGVYFYRLRAGEFSDIRKMLLIR